MQLIHYYVQKGFDWDRLAGASENEKTFLAASMELELEFEAARYKELAGKS